MSGKDGPPLGLIGTRDLSQGTLLQVNSVGGQGGLPRGEVGAGYR